LKNDKSVESAIDRIDQRFEYFSLTGTQLDAKFCGKADWIREGILKFQKDYKNYQGKITETYKGFLADAEKYCVGTNLNPTGTYFSRLKTKYSKRPGDAPEEVTCRTRIYGSGLFDEDCGFTSDNTLFLKSSGKWQTENGNQVVFKYTSIYKWFVDDQQYFDAIVKGVTNRITLTPTSITNNHGETFIPICSANQPSILCREDDDDDY
jgi:hypothetical protein